VRVTSFSCCCCCQCLANCSRPYRLLVLSPDFVTFIKKTSHLIAGIRIVHIYNSVQERLAVASIARDVVEMTPPRDNNAR